MSRAKLIKKKIFFKKGLTTGSFCDIIFESLIKLKNYKPNKYGEVA